MFGLEALDVAIGLAFVYLLLSLVCSAVNELIETWMKRRAGDLERGIRELLHDASGQDVVKRLYDHPLVSGLFPGAYDPAKIKNGQYAAKSNLPSYIPARIFALALMDVVMPATTGGGSGAQGATTPADAKASSPLQPLRNAIDAFPNAHVQQALRTLVDAAGDDIVKARENIENWFNSSMDRVSGWYKRRTQMILLGIGLFVTVAVNADTITIANSLSSDQALRGSLVAAAAEYAKAPPTPAATAPVGDDPCGADPASPECRVQNNLSQIKKLGLPVGWDAANPLTNPPSLGAWIVKVIGWLITAAAISLGAAFWFDVLNKIMVIRSTVKPHEKSREEPSADRK